MVNKNFVRSQIDSLNEQINELKNNIEYTTKIVWDMESELEDFNNELEDLESLLLDNQI